MTGRAGPTGWMPLPHLHPRRPGEPLIWLRHSPKFPEAVMAIHFKFGNYEHTFFAFKRAHCCMTRQEDSVSLFLNLRCLIRSLGEEHGGGGGGGLLGSKRSPPLLWEREWPRTLTILYFRPRRVCWQTMEEAPA